MTAKQLKQSAEVITTVGGYWFSDTDFQTFCETLCREQRDLCAEVDDIMRFGYNEITPDGKLCKGPSSIYINQNQVLNAPFPEL